MEITRKIVKQPFAPDTTDVLWLDSSGDSDVLKSFCNGQWKEVAGASGSSEPLVVEGVYESNEFYPYDDQPSFSNAHDAFVSGRPAYLTFLAGEENNSFTVMTKICSSVIRNNIRILTGGDVHWSEDNYIVPRSTSFDPKS